MNQTPVFKPSHVLAAADLWKQNPGYGRFRQSVRYDVIINGEHFRPKAVAAIAQELAGEPLMSPKDFAGAKEGRWHKALNMAGFDVLDKKQHQSKEKLPSLAINNNQRDEVSDQLLADLANLLNETPATTRLQWIEARLGQGQFREKMLTLWGNRCAVTECTLLSLIRASHAKPWRFCENKPHQRIDPNNGLPLVANLDALFDAGWIAFKMDGSMLVAPNEAVELLLRGVPRHLVKKPSLQQGQFLDWHRKYVYKAR